MQEVCGPQGRTLLKNRPYLVTFHEYLDHTMNFSAEPRKRPFECLKVTYAELITTEVLLSNRLHTKAREMSLTYNLTYSLEEKI